MIWREVERFLIIVIFVKVSKGQKQNTWVYTYEAPMRLQSRRTGVQRRCCPHIGAVSLFFFFFSWYAPIHADPGQGANRDNSCRFRPNQVISSKTTEIGQFSPYRRQYGRFRPKRTVSNQALNRKLWTLYPFVFRSMLSSPSWLCALPSHRTILKSLRQFQSLTHTLTDSLSALRLHHLHHSVSSFNSQAHRPNSQLRYQSFHSQFLTLHYTLTCSITHCDLIFINFFNFFLYKLPVMLWVVTWV